MEKIVNIILKQEAYWNQPFLIEAQWTEWSYENDQRRQQLVLDNKNRDTILQFMDQTYQHKDVDILVQDIDSQQAIRQMKGIIGLRLLSRPNLLPINSLVTLHDYLITFHLSTFMRMAANYKQPQLQLESLRLLNCVTSVVSEFKEKICTKIILKGITILTKLLYSKNVEILSRVILIFGNISKQAWWIHNQIIQEDIIYRLVKIGQNENKKEIKLKCCWTLTSLCKVYTPLWKIVPVFYWIVSFLCELLISNIVSSKTLFCMCCSTLTKLKVVKPMMKQKLYKHIFRINIQKDRDFILPCLCVLLGLKNQNIQVKSLLIEEGICDFIFQCLCLSKQQQELNNCFKIINFLSRHSTPVLIKSLLNHKQLINKMVQLTKLGNMAIDHSKTFCIVQQFTQIIDNMLKSCGSWRKFQTKLIDLGIIETIVQIMRNNIYDNDKIIMCFHIMLIFEQKEDFRTTRLFALLERLKFDKILQQKLTQRKSLSVQTINLLRRLFDARN